MEDRKRLDQLLDIEYPILMAPMFLISNTKMIIAALESGCTAAFPALNYRTNKELIKAVSEIRKASSKPFGVNLIVNKSNPKYKSQLKVLFDLEIDYIITSLGNPKEVINECKPKGIKVFCDVTNATYAKKVEQLGADAVIAVNSEAGGHCGDLPAKYLINQLQKEISIPIISAGGITSKNDINQVLEWGAAGVSVGSIFIATYESNVSLEYKKAIVNYGSQDIVKSTKLTGSPLTVINTPYVQKIGTKSSLLEWLVNNSSLLKKYAKMALAWNGMNKVKKSAFQANYNNVWCAGPSIESVNRIRSVKDVISDLIN